MLLRCCVVSLLIGLLYNKKVKYETVSTLCHISGEIKKKIKKSKRIICHENSPQRYRYFNFESFSEFWFYFSFLNKTFVSKFEE